MDDGSETAVREDMVNRCLGDISSTLIRQTHAGLALGRNNALRAARGTFVAFIDDDCVACPDWLPVMWERLAQKPEALVGGRVINRYPGRLFCASSQILIDYLRETLLVGRLESRFLVGNNIACRRESLISLGGFGEEFRGIAAGEDRDLGSRWACAGLELVYEARAVVLHGHTLSFISFTIQQFRYGIGTYRYRKARNHIWGNGFRFERAGFYVRLIVFPFRRVKGLRGVLMSMALAWSQVATTIGFAYAAYVQVTRAHRRRGD